MRIETLEMYIAVCDECDWKSNPHLTKEDAEAAYEFHVNEVHSE